MIFQHFNLLSNRIVFANVALPMELAEGVSRDRVWELLELTGLTKIVF